MSQDRGDGSTTKIERSVQWEGPRTGSRPQNVTRVISFTGGKGGVGKTNSVVNVGVAFSRMGKSVLILDADLGLANVDILLGLTPRYTLADLFAGTRTLEEIMLTGPEGISIIPSASGVESLGYLDTADRLLLLNAIEEIAHRFDYLLIDTQAGIGSDVMYFNSASSEIVCVITPDPTSLTDAYAVVKVLAQNYGEKSFSVLVNNVTGSGEGSSTRSSGHEAEARATFERFSRAVHRFLKVEARYLGYVPSDAAVREAIRGQQALLSLYPSSPAARAYTAIAGSLDAEFFQYRIKGGMQFFFRSILGMGDAKGIEDFRAR